MLWIYDPRILLVSPPLRCAENANSKADHRLYACGEPALQDNPMNIGTN